MAVHLLKDYETRCDISVVDVGPWRYAGDPSNEPLCVGWRVKRDGRWDDPLVAILCPGSDGRRAVERRVEERGFKVAAVDDYRRDYLSADLHVAHNTAFEQATEYYHLNDLRPLDRRWSCTASRARRLGLPGSLEDACKVLRTPHQKSVDGHGAMLQCAQPRPVWRKDSGQQKWFEDADRLGRVAIYCVEDILAECDLHDYLPELPPSERAYWEHTELCNRRGIRLDVPLIDAMMRTVADDVSSALDEARRATGAPDFELTNPQRIKDFCARMGVVLPDLTKETVRDVLQLHENGQRPIPEPVRIVLEGRRQVGGKTSAAKLPRMRERVCVDGRARDLTIYHGAHTGRTTGDGINTLNLPRPYRGFDQDVVCDLLLQDRASEIRTLQKVSPSVAVSSALRGVLVPAPGNIFVIGDYSSVEPCFYFTLAEQWDAVEILRRKESLYIDFGVGVYGRRLDKVADLWEYTAMKETVLGGAYGLGATRFNSYLAERGVVLPMEETNRIHAGYRQRYFKLQEAWKGLESAAKAAMQTPGQRYEWHGVEYVWDGYWLVCGLPSGRPFYYPHARLQPGKYGDEIVYEGWMRIDGRPAGWGDIRTWGGSLLENVTQAACRDIMEEHQQEVERRPGWEMRLTVYDELVVECPEREAPIAVEVLEGIMSRVPAWMPLMPVSAKAFVSKRYRKD